MANSEFDASTLPAPHRRSLLALGGAGLATALSGVFEVSAASTAGKRGKKRCKNKCKGQVSQCTLVANLTCNQANDPVACKEQFLPCCDLLATCKAGEMMQCILT